MRPVIGARRVAVLPHGAREAAVEAEEPLVAVEEPLVAAEVAAVAVAVVDVGEQGIEDDDKD